MCTPAARLPSTHAVADPRHALRRQGMHLAERSQRSGARAQSYQYQGAVRSVQSTCRDWLVELGACGFGDGVRSVRLMRVCAHCTTGTRTIGKMSRIDTLCSLSADCRLVCGYQEARKSGLAMAARC